MNRCGRDMSRRMTLTSAKTVASPSEPYRSISRRSKSSTLTLTVLIHILRLLHPSLSRLGPFLFIRARSIPPHTSSPSNGTGTTARASKHGEKSNTRRREMGV